MVKFIISESSPSYLNSNSGLIKCLFKAFQKVENSSRLIRFEDLPKVLSETKPSYLIMFGTFAHNSLLYEDIIYLFKKNRKGKIVWWTHDDPYEFDIIEKIKDFGDIFITNDKSSLMFYPPEFPSFHLPLAGCDECFYEPVTIKNDRINFIGNAHEERVDFFSKIKRKNLDIFGTNWPNEIPVRINQKVNKGFAKKIYNNYAGSIDFQRTSNLYNKYFQINSSTPSPRLFEMAIAGANIYIHSNSIEVFSYFNHEDISFGESENEILEFINKSSTDRKWSLKNSVNVQRQALENHTYVNRVQYLLNILK